MVVPLPEGKTHKPKAPPAAAVLPPPLLVPNEPKLPRLFVVFQPAAASLPAVLPAAVC